jgi:prepilin-type N-terminal cleavage/methylation domain-containing protein
MIHHRGPGARGRRSRRRRDGRDEGVTLIEVLVAILLLGILVTPAARIVVETGAAANQYRLRSEASNVATQFLEQVENNAYFGEIDPTTSVTPFTVVENGQNQIGANPDQVFKVTTSYTVKTATDQSVCQSGAGTVGSQIWVVTVSVAWTGDGTPVVQTSYIAPEQAGAVPSASGEIAVPVDTAAENGTPYTASAVPVTVIGTYTGPGMAPSIPAGTFTFETGDTGVYGCAVFDNLDPTAGYTWTVYLGPGNSVTQTASNQTALVTSQEQPGLVNGNLATQTTVPQETVSTVQIGSVTIAAPFYVDPGASVTVSYPVYNGTTILPSVTAAADLPVTVQATPQLTGTNSTFSFNTVASSTQITTVQLFPYNDYFGWAGDASDSNPNYQVSGANVYTGGPGPTPLDTTQTGPFSLALPTFDADFGAVAPPAGVQLTATEVNVSPNETFTLNAFTGTGAKTSQTGLPVGEYLLGATGGHTVTPAYYFWVTPTKVYYGAVQQSTPTAFTLNAASGTPITVVVS